MQKHTKILSYKEFYRFAFSHYLRKGVMYDYDHYLSYHRTKMAEEMERKNNDEPRYYIWRTQGDGNVREEHAAKDGEIFDWNAGGEKPGDAYNCRCYAEFIEDMVDNQDNSDDLDDYDFDYGDEEGNYYDDYDLLEDENSNKADLNKVLNYSKEIYEENLEQGRPYGNKQCAQRVREALAEGGVKLEQHNSAKDYGSSLVNAGFEPIANHKHGEGYDNYPENYDPIAGDVVILQDSDGHPHGHMAIYDGEYWYSDFKQRDMHGGPGTRLNDPDYIIYRYYDWLF